MNYVFASFFNSMKCPQRNVQWPSDINLLMPLIHSVLAKSDAKIIIFHDNLTNLPNIDRCVWKKVDISGLYAVTIERWFHYLEEIKTNSDIDTVFMVDSTDVTMIHNPFTFVKNNVLYCGSEYKWRVGDRWLKKRRKKLDKKFYFDDYLKLLEQNADKVMLNAGIVGAQKNIMIEFLQKLTELHVTHSMQIEKSLDMNMFNYAILRHFNHRHETGEKIHTAFKSYEQNGIGWWKHK